MLSEELAQALIGELAQCTDYPIHILNKSGTVIAGSDKIQTGLFHNTVYEMLHEKIDSIEVFGQDRYPGLETGVYLTLQYKNKVLGAIGIIGDPESLDSVAPIIRKSAELILARELNKMALFPQHNAKSQLLNYLMYYDINHLNYNRVKSIGKSLGYEEGLPRMPILLSSCRKIDVKLFFKYFRETVCVHAQDLVATDEKGNIVIFYAYTEKTEGFFCNYKYLIQDYLHSFLSCCNLQELGLRVSTGPVETTWPDYKFSYEKALWIHENIKESQPGETYFYEHMDEYLKSRLPLIELHKIFDFFMNNLSEQFLDTFVKHIGVLYENNYNFQKSSDELYIHKNTLAFRMDKIRGQLGVDPIRNSKDRELAEYFYYYLTHIPSHPLLEN